MSLASVHLVLVLAFSSQLLITLLVLRGAALPAIVLLLERQELGHEGLDVTGGEDGAPDGMRQEV